MTYEEFIAQWSDPLKRREGISAKTSGSTGKPKEIVLPQNIVTESALRTISFFDITAKSHLHSCISPDFIGGKMMAVRAILSNARFTWEIPSNRPEICRDGIPDLVSVVPSQMLHIIGNTEIADKCRYKCRFLIGGSPINGELAKKIADSGLEAWESYGMTETASHIAIRRITNDDIPFYPLPGIDIATDAEDCLCIDLGNNYIIHTNDVAHISADKGFRILGRADNVIITGGKKVFPEEVERKIAPLLAQEGFDTFLITSEPDIKWGNRIILLIENRDNNTILPEILTEKLRKVIKSHEMPKEIHLTDSIPRTHNGKIKRV